MDNFAWYLYGFSTVAAGSPQPDHRAPSHNPSERDRAALALGVVDAKDDGCPRPAHSVMKDIEALFAPAEAQ